MKKGRKGERRTFLPAACILTITTLTIRTRTSGELNSNFYIRKTSCICFSRLINPDLVNWLYWLALNSCISYPAMLQKTLVLLNLGHKNSKKEY